MDVALGQSRRPVAYCGERSAAVLLSHASYTTAAARLPAQGEDLQVGFFAGAVAALEMIGLAAAVLAEGSELICSNGPFSQLRAQGLPATRQPSRINQRRVGTSHGKSSGCTGKSFGPASHREFPHPHRLRAHRPGRVCRDD
jgi:hypothetical protein